eukprot:scaffold17559_cov110-Isochrysis_galbana.AAC.10
MSQSCAFDAGAAVASQAEAMGRALRDWRLPIVEVDVPRTGATAPQLGWRTTWHRYAAMQQHSGERDMGQWPKMRKRKGMSEAVKLAMAHTATRRTHLDTGVRLRSNAAMAC